MPRVTLVTDQAHNSHRTLSGFQTTARPPQPVMDTEKGVHDETALSSQSLALPIMLTLNSALVIAAGNVIRAQRPDLGPESLDLS